MSIYAHVRNDTVVGFNEIPTQLHAAWVATGNPKATEYRLLVVVSQPEITETQFAVLSYTIETTTVTQTWTIREKTIEEYDKDDVKYVFQDFLLYNAGII